MVAFFASARSLQIGPAVPVIAVTAIAGNASAIPAGIVVFGDPLGSDAITVIVRVVAFLLGRNGNAADYWVTRGPPAAPICAA